MKKFIRKTGNIRLESIVESDGIAFEITKATNSVTNEGVNTSVEGPFAMVDYDGEIVSKITQPKRTHIEHQIDKLTTKYMKSFFIAIIVLITGSFISVCFEPKIIFYLLMILCNLLMIAFMFQRGIAICILKHRGDNDIKSFCKFSAAKNAVENAYYDLRKVPTLNQAKEYSCFSRKDKNIIFPSISLLFIGNIVQMFLSDIMKVISFIIILLLIIVIEYFKLFRFWQSMVLSKPNDIHYEVAIHALKQADGLFKDNKIKDPNSFVENNLQPIEVIDGEIIYDFNKGNQ